jgi:hypothetical protein
MRPLAWTLALLILAPLASAQETPALDNLKAEMREARLASGIGFLVPGICLAVYGILQYQDAREAADEAERLGVDGPPVYRHLLFTLGGTTMVGCGLSELGLFYDGASSPPDQSKEKEKPKKEEKKRSRYYGNF